ncbi:hypothetical protein M069_1393 [Bacteroides fragilis str. B1 (UDC16-1)]|nr:hypothetical protein M069_1393 [Bacteroides fragilis str. B1 (UDC16-1)]
MSSPWMMATIHIGKSKTGERKNENCIFSVFFREIPVFYQFP